MYCKLNFILIFIMGSSGSRVIERTVGESRQRPPLAFVLKEDILSTCSNKNDTM